MPSWTSLVASRADWWPLFGIFLTRGFANQWRESVVPYKQPQNPLITLLLRRNYTMRRISTLTRYHPYRRTGRNPSIVEAGRRVGIHSLPVEILLRIFRDSCSPIQSLDDDVDIPEIGDLLSLALVCKHWYTIVINTPAFWTDLACGDDMVLEARLAHTGNSSPLRFVRSDVTFHVLPRRSTERIFSELYRLREFKAWLSSSDFPIVSGSLNGEAPVLEILELHIPYGSPTRSFDLNIFGGHRPPRLHTLGLRGYKLPWDSQLLFNLTSLNLDSQERPATAQFYEVLGHMPHLQFLGLSECLPLSFPRLCPELSLPDLCDLTLHDDIDLSTDFLRLLKASPSSLALFGYTTVSEITPLLKECNRILSKTLTTSFWSDLSLCLDLTDYGPVLDVSGYAEDAHGSFTDIFHAEFDLSLGITPEALDLAVESIITTLPVSTAESLDLFYAPANLVHMWLNVVASKMKNIRAVRLSCASMVGFLTIYNAYLDGSIRFVRDDRKEGEDNDGAMAFSKLQEVTWEACSPSVAELVEPYLRAVVSARWRLGLPRLIVELTYTDHHHHHHHQ